MPYNVGINNIIAKYKIYLFIVYYFFFNKMRKNEYIFQWLEMFLVLFNYVISNLYSNFRKTGKIVYYLITGSDYLYHLNIFFNFFR